MISSIQQLHAVFKEMYATDPLNRVIEFAHRGSKGPQAHMPPYIMTPPPRDFDWPVFKTRTAFEVAIQELENQGYVRMSGTKIYLLPKLAE